MGIHPRAPNLPVRRMKRAIWEDQCDVICPVAQTLETTETDQPIAVATWRDALADRVPLLCLLAGLVTLLLVPLIISSHGFTPGDDALRHSAKAVSGRDWSDVILLRESIYPQMDTHYGWHWLLSTLHQTLGWDQDLLVAASIFILFWVVTIPGLLSFRRPEAFLIVLLFVSMAASGLFNRLNLGRPYLVSCGTLLAMFAIWDILQRGGDKRRWYPVLTVLTVLCVWFESAWYLLSLPLFAFFLTGRFRQTFEMAGLVAVGVLGGALLTGHPVDYLIYQVQHLYLALLQGGNEHAFVSEFGGFKGFDFFVFGAGLLAVYFFLSDQAHHAFFRHPSFILMLTGWLLGLFVTRFWIDWGMIAGMYWMALVLQKQMERRLSWTDWRRLAIISYVCLAFLISIYRDPLDTWQKDQTQLMLADLRKNQEELVAAMPDPGGVIYSPSMQPFYLLYHLFPSGEWKYSTSFEAALMPEMDYAIYLDFFATMDVRALQPWVGKMRPEDRLILVSPQQNPPEKLQRVTWTQVGPLWIARKTPAAPADEPEGEGDVPPAEPAAEELALSPLR